MTSKELFAYLAGVIDSDGTIGIKKSTYSMRVTGDSGQATYSERVSVRQVEPGAVDLLVQTFGGSHYMTKPSAVKGRPLHTWAVTDLRAAACLRAIRRYLLVKGPQADNALVLRKAKDQSKKIRVAKGRGHAGSSARTPEMSAEMERLYLLAKQLNTVGC
jgi:hypothetical protein